MCLHGFTDTWRTWELVLPALEREHDVLAPTLPGHAGGAADCGRELAACWPTRSSAPWTTRASGTAHIVGNSLGGYVALQLAARGRAASVVALAPAGGWAPGDESFRDTLGALHDDAGAAPSRRAPRRGDRRNAGGPAPRDAVHHHECFEHIPRELLAHQMRRRRSLPGGAAPLVEYALRDGWPLEAERITCPVRVVWGTDDRLLPWPTAPRASATTGCRMPTGSCSTASGTALSSTSRSRRRS